MMREINYFSPQARDSRIIRELASTYTKYSEGINFDWLNGWKCWTLASRTFRWRRVTEDLKMGGPCHLKCQQLAKVIKIKVLLRQFPKVIFILHYLYLWLNFATETCNH